MRQRLLLLSPILLALSLAASPAPEARPRLRDLGITPGILPAGPHNAITDVPGVLVGHRTLVRDDSVRTGVTAILPHGGNLFRNKVPAAVHVGNGFGKAAGFLQAVYNSLLKATTVTGHQGHVGEAIPLGPLRQALAAGPGRPERN